MWIDFGMLAARNNFITGCAMGIKELLATGDVIPVNNLFFGNTTDFYDENAVAITGANAINLTVAGAAGDVGGDPLFLNGYSYPWTAGGVYNPATYTTTLTDSLGTGGGGNVLAGWYVNPDVTQGRCFAIESSTATTLVVWGDASTITQNGDTYRIHSLRIQAGSAALDVGSTAITGLPADDIDGEPRPGPDGLADIGADEFDDQDGDGSSNGFDNCPAVFNPTQADSDGVTYGDACDCAPLDGYVYPGAPEVNDGVDNQCPSAAAPATRPPAPSAACPDCRSLAARASRRS
jgi:hypothetical protein